MNKDETDAMVEAHREAAWAASGAAAGDAARAVARAKQENHLREILMEEGK